MKKYLYTAVTIIGTLLSVNTAQAFVAIDVNAIDINSTSTGYNYKIQSTCLLGCSETISGLTIPEAFKTTDFYLPYFSDAGISNISSPAGWTSMIESSNDRFNLGNGAGVIHWHALSGHELGLDSTLSGFIYTSTLTGSVKAPFSLDYIGAGPWDGDPPIPASPSAIAAGLPKISAVPIPAAVWLFLTGILSLFGLQSRKQHALQLAY
ncbi:MAG TPA: hypothetical protein ENJ32_06465 [Crenotrichaceae bacterium]|nr:hypothetical protein [Crenotrichaceae bacterium]